MGFKMKVVLNWTQFSSYETVPEKSGLYLYSLKDFDFAPFYIGTAGEKDSSSLRSRLATNNKEFLCGKRTFLKSIFFDGKSSNLDSFISKWCGVNKENWSNFIFVPDKHQVFEKEEAKIFWSHRLVKFYAELELTNHRNSLRSVEAQVQNFVRSYYNSKGASLKIPDTNSFLLGQMNEEDLRLGKDLEIVHTGQPEAIFKNMSIF